MTHHRPADFVATDGALAATAEGTPAAVRTGSGPARVRPLERRDLEPVADLFLRVFRGMDDARRRAAALPGLVAYLDQLYLDSPWSTPERGSLVDLTGDGAIRGFLGSLEIPMRFDDTPLSAGAMGAFMVAGTHHDSQAALSLIRHYLRNGLDIHFTDTANRTSFELGRPLKFETLVLNSLEWVVALRPASLALERAGRRWPLVPTRLLGPVARGLDGPLGRMLPHEKRERRHPDPTIETMSVEDFVAAAPSYVADFRLRPDWGPEQLTWLIGQAAQKRGNGPLRIRRVRDHTGREIGCWLAHGEAGAVAAVVQILARPRSERAVVEAVIRDATEIGCLAVRGATEPVLMEALFAIPGALFHHKGVTNFRSRHTDLMEAVRSGARLSIGGLSGEGWTRLVSDRF